jgi:hypothetical protein
MGHMQAEWYETDYWRVETTAGTWIIPQDVESDPNNLAAYVEGEIADPEQDVYAEHGWIGRLSAPGYLDATDWSAAETEQDLKEQLAELYELCPEHLTDLNEEYDCEECKAQD